MSNKKINLKYPKERAILSDVLPFELPISFTNRHFYSFLTDNKIQISKNKGTCKISWLNSNPTLDIIIQLLFGLLGDESCISTGKRYIGSRAIKFKVYKFKNRAAIPFDYKIRHNNEEFRELTVPHPRSQVELVEFYETCKETIIYYCSGSNFSIRKPIRVAKCKFYKDKTHSKKRAKKKDQIEEQGKEYENLRSFFVYEKYSNIHEFYESYQYHRCEKKYNRLLKLDISKCFESIYTHSLAWSTYGKSFVKENLSSIDTTFAGRFDRLMQNMNYQETNGIIIGPEFSRIFAEILLQAIDKKLELELQLCEKKLKNKVDYEIFRYVDDYFIFYNKEEHKGTIKDTLQHILKEYKLYLNMSKALEYDKPLITEISMAKQKIAALLEEKLTYQLAGKEDSENQTPKGSFHIKLDELVNRLKIEEKLIYQLAGKEDRGNQIPKGSFHIKLDELVNRFKMEEKLIYQFGGKDGESQIAKGSIYIKLDKLITRFKTIIKEYNIPYKDMLNYSLAIVENKSEEILKKYFEAAVGNKSDLRKYSEATNTCRADKQIINAIIAILEFAFFIYSVSPRVNTTIRICRIIKVFCEFFKTKGKETNKEYKHLIYKCIYDNVCFILSNNERNEHTQVETLYLLIVLIELGKGYWLKEDILARYFKICEDDKGTYKSKTKLNYLSYTVLLFYMRKKARYERLRSYVVGEIKQNLTDNTHILGKSAEYTMLLLDTLSCPFVEEKIKRDILSENGIEDRETQNNIINFKNKSGKSQFWFTTWKNFNIGKELDTKRSQEVY